MKRKCLAELIGTYGLVFCGTGALVVNDLTGGTISHVGVALTFGLVVVAMIYAFGDISGAHINPAVTVGFWLAGRLPSGQVMPYVVAQLAGAGLASASLWLLFPAHPNLGATLPTVDVWRLFGLEVMLTFLLMLVIANVSSGPKELGVMAGIAVGATVALEALFAGPITGASMNPARSAAPALLSGQTEHLWVYLTAPVVGAALGVLGCRGVKPEGCCAGPSAACWRGPWTR